MKFRAAVRDTAEITDHLQSGLDALKRAHRSSIDVPDPKRLAGSVDLDAALQAAYPNATRWDYAIGYRISNKNDRAFFVEFHRATVDEVPRVIQKKQWLESWLQGKPLGKFQERRFVWVSTGGVNIPLNPNSPQRRQLNGAGLRLKRRLQLG